MFFLSKQTQTFIKHLCKCYFLIVPLSFFAQVSPNFDENTITSGTCIACSVQNPENARDLSSSSFAFFDLTGLPANVLGHISRDYLFSSNLPIDNEITILFSFSDNSLLNSLGTNVANAVIFDRLQIDLMNNNTLISSYGGNGLLTNLAEINVLDPSTSTFNVVIKVPSNNINKIRIKAGSLVSLGLGLVPSNIEVYDIVSSLTQRYYASRYTGNSGQVGASLLGCLNCSVAQETQAETYSRDPNYEYAFFRWDIGLSLLGGEYQFIEYDWGAAPIDDFLGDQDGIPDALVFTLQESSVVDLGLSDLGLGLWSSGGLELLVHYTDLTNSLYNSSSSLLSASVLGNGSGRFKIVFNIPANKTVDRVELRRVAPTVGLFTEVRLYSIFSVPQKILPLELNSFKLTKEQQTVVLNWSTLGQDDIASYDIERSTDGINFEPLAQNLSSISATFTDNYPLANYNYYRLKVNEIDETTSYSAIQTILMPNITNYKFNHTFNKLVIQNCEPLKEAQKVLIHSMNGQVIGQYKFAKGSQLLIIENTSNFPNLFSVTIQSKSSQIFSKILNKQP